MRLYTFCCFLVLIATAGSALAQNEVSSQCQSVGGTMSTNLGVVDASTTLGTATGDLAGAVTAQILNVSQNADGTVSFTVQHHLVTESGDTVSFNQATAVTMPLSATLFALVRYPVHINGGTGKFAKAKGDLNAIGEVDLGAGTTVFRYSGKICFAK